jgi:hypothetical protein
LPMSPRLLGHNCIIVPVLTVAGCTALTDPTAENNWQAASPEN